LRSRPGWDSQIGAPSEDTGRIVKRRVGSKQTGSKLNALAVEPDLAHSHQVWDSRPKLWDSVQMLSACGELRFGKRLRWGHAPAV
ncbi:MAG TPA: hypothetical protein VIU82_08120, partial [Bosea sp. (in: a-proteobacteria)]